MSGSQFNSKS